MWKFILGFVLGIFLFGVPGAILAFFIAIHPWMAPYTAEAISAINPVMGVYLGAEPPGYEIDFDDGPAEPVTISFTLPSGSRGALQMPLREYHELRARKLSGPSLLGIKTPLGHDLYLDFLMAENTPPSDTWGKTICERAGYKRHPYRCLISGGGKKE